MLVLTTIGWVLSVAVSLFLMKSSFDKIRGTEEMKQNFEFMKLSNYRILTGVGELLGSVLLLVPFTSMYGAFLITAFMSAAVVIHLSLFGGSKTNVPLAVGVAAFLGFLFRSL